MSDSLSISGGRHLFVSLFLVAFERSDEGWYEAIQAEAHCDMLTLRWPKRYVSIGVGCGRRSAATMTMGQLAARLAGGFLQPIDPDALRDAVREALGTIDLGELEPIKNLPGMLRAAGGTLDKLWRAGIDLAEETHPRLQAIRTLEVELSCGQSKHRSGESRIKLEAHRPATRPSVAFSELGSCRESSATR